MAVQLELPPGFRFHPTDEELVMHYLCRKCASHPISVPIIAEIDLYKFNPWDLPGNWFLIFFLYLNSSQGNFIKIFFCISLNVEILYWQKKLPWLIMCFNLLWWLVLYLRNANISPIFNFEEASLIWCN